MKAVKLSEDLESFVRDAVSTGRYASEDSVISDALNRLREAIEPGTKNLDTSAHTGEPGKSLTRQEFQRHLVEIGLLDQPTQPDASPHDPDEVVDHEGEILSEVVIRERLIEWLTGFL